MAKSKNDQERLPVARGYERDEGYVRVWRELYTCYGRRLGLDGISLWMFLRDHVNRTNGFAWPGYRLIQATFGLSRRGSLKNMLTTLEAAGLIEPRRALEAVPDSRDRRELHINDRARVYLVHDPPPAAVFATLTGGRNCHVCPYLARCKPGQLVLEGGGYKTQPPLDQGAASLGGGYKMQPPVVAKRNQNKNNSVVVVEPDLQARMTALHIKAPKQTALRRAHSPEYLRQKLDMVEARQAAGDVERPAGWFIRACEEDWLPAFSMKPRPIKTKPQPADKSAAAGRHYF